MKYKVNIIVPIYNTQEKCLRRCVSSLKMQSYNNLLCWFIDDGSNETTHQLIDEICTFENSVVIHCDWGGVSRARNTGLKMLSYSNEELIMFLDSDDYIGVNYIKDCELIFEKMNPSILCTMRTVEWDNEKKVDGYNERLINKELRGDDATLDLVSSRISTSVCGKLYSASLLRDIFFDEELSVAEDTAIMYKIFEKAKKVYMSEVASLYINRHNGIHSLTRSMWTKKKCLSIIRADRFRLSNLVDSFTKEKNEIINQRILYDCAGNFLEIYPRIKKDELSEQELIELEEYIVYIDRTHLFRYFKPKSFKEKVKKITFLSFRTFYSVLYRQFLKD